MIFGRLLSKKASPTEAVQRQSIAIAADGLRYRSPAPTAAEWLAMPLVYGDADLGSRLSQIYLEGYGEPEEAEFFLPWSDVYALLAHPEFSAYREALLIPPGSDARPRITSRGALMDPDFAILIDGWFDQHGRPSQPVPRLTGRVLQSGSSQSLASPGVHDVLTQLEAFHAAPVSERTQSFKEQAFGRIRRLALAAGCPLTDYVARTIVLTPERVRLSLDQRDTGAGALVEVIPGFDDAPERWLNQFDRLPLQDSYDVPDGASLVRVVLTPEVKSVFAEIKRMPGRRVAGERAESFVRNPFAVLGESAHAVLDPDEFDRARREAGIRFERFSPRVERGARGEVVRVGVEIEPLDDASGAEPETIWFADSGELVRFCAQLEAQLQQGAQCITWHRRALEIVGDSLEHHAQLVAWEREWGSPALWTAAEVLDLSKYSERIAEIGIDRPVVTPVIVKKDESAGWFEENAQAGIVVEQDSGPPKIVPIRFGEIPSLREAVAAAESAGKPVVVLPGLVTPVPLNDARLAVQALERAQQELKADRFEPGGHGPAPSGPKKRLVLKHNLDEIDYTEQRAETLELPEGAVPRLPAGLRPDVRLKAHQEVGVAWLQHLWSASPHNCRGTVLADDMGLGKTLQLLCFMAKCFEDEPDLPPALVVAPVALLENWCNEIARFFEPGTLPVLTLYGAQLKSLRAGKHDVDQALREQGITRLLKKEWVGNARLVLTTYETMRDLEFAMASQAWSIMVCDEAQKIKTPAAMVTRAAKKQKVRFRIACTGTPVENTLADLWCLFDFVQPGMLGALSHFSRTYRQPIEARTEEQRAKVEELRTTIKPQILHRLKTEVATDLPRPREVHECKSLPMSAYQDRLYEGALAELREQRATNPSAQLQALLAIRKICSDPHGHAETDTRKLPIDRVLNESPKMGWLVETLRELAADKAGDHKVIIFCEFRELQLQLQRVVAAFFGFAPSIVNGSTSADPRAAENRQQLIDAFQAKPGFNVIILSPVAVGFGVNIQAANHVIHFTRTWNPAKEDQATARAYRIGQTRTVSVYYPGVVSDKHPSFDERLDALLARKRALAADMLNGCSDLTAADFADFG